VESDENAGALGFLFFGHFQSKEKYEKIHPFDGSNEYSI
jgi:hypothetical protein